MVTYFRHQTCVCGWFPRDLQKLQNQASAVNMVFHRRIDKHTANANIQL